MSHRKTDLGIPHRSKSAKVVLSPIAGQDPKRSYQLLISAALALGQTRSAEHADTRASTPCYSTFAALAALATVFYIVIYGYNPRDPQGSFGLMLHLHKRHIIAYFVLLAIGLTAFSLAAFIQRLCKCI